MMYDHDTLDKDDEIGEAKLAVKDLKNQEEKDIWLDINECQPDQANNHKVRSLPSQAEVSRDCAAPLPCSRTRDIRRNDAFLLLLGKVQEEPVFDTCACRPCYCDMVFCNAWVSCKSVRQVPAHAWADLWSDV